MAGLGRNSQSFPLSWRRWRITMTSLLLYGSFARGDNDAGSDVDLLSVTGRDDPPRKIARKHVNVTVYSFAKMSAMALEGALFVFHLSSEGIILIDEDSILDRILNELFVLRGSYAPEISFARRLVREIIDRYDSTSNVLFAHTKIAWCARTVFAAVGASNSVPVFSKNSICKEIGSEAVLGDQKAESACDRESAPHSRTDRESRHRHSRDRTARGLTCIGACGAQPSRG
jgi:predicted nucleotidyltransferase